MLQLLLGVFFGFHYAGANSGERASGPFCRFALACLNGVVQCGVAVDAGHCVGDGALSVVVGYGGGRPMVDVARRCVRRDVPDRQCVAIAEIR